MTEEKLRELLKTECTPCYVFDLARLRERVQILKENLPERVKLCYAIKANTFILKSLEPWVDYLEICSPGEYRICEKLKLPYEKYVVSGVNKEPGFIQNLINEQKHVGCFTIESMKQFWMIQEAAERTQRQIPIMLRLTSGNQFGLDKKDLFSLIRTYKDYNWISIVGIQYFSGTQKTSLKKLKREITYLDMVVMELYEEYGFDVKKLEYGPGFPVSYFEGETFDEIRFLQEFSGQIQSMGYKGEIALELGRSIAADCGTYLTSVVDTKCNNSERYAIVDGGMHQMVYYGQSMAMKHPKIRLLTNHAKNVMHTWNVCGSLCTVNDFLVKRYPFPGLVPGDVLAFENTGAYCVTEGIALFLSRELPGVVLMSENGDFTVVRNQISTELFNAPQI